MDVIAAVSSEDLLRQLAELDISVPPRTQGRTKQHVERWSAARFLATYARSQLLEYPLSVVTRDRPDLSIVLPQYTIGMEITEAVPANWARASALHAHREYENAMLIPHSRPGESDLPLQEIERIAQGEAMSMPWVGDSAEKEWAEVMLHFALEKAEKLVRPGFERFDQDWLLIYDNWPLPAVEEEIAAGFLAARMSTLEQGLPFHAIFVEGNKHFWRVQDSKVTSAPIPHIWGQ